MKETAIENRAPEVPFAGILADLLAANLAQHPEKEALFCTMAGTVAVELSDIDAAVTLVFDRGHLRIEAGICGSPALVIGTTSGSVTDLNNLTIVAGLPWYFDRRGLTVLSHLLTGRLTIKGLFSHPVLLTRLTVILSVR